MRRVLLDDVPQDTADRILILSLLVEGRRVERGLEIEQHHQRRRDHGYRQAVAAAADRQVSVDGLRQREGREQDRRRERRQHVIGPALGLGDRRYRRTEAERQQRTRRQRPREEDRECPEDQQRDQGRQHHV